MNEDNAFYNQYLDNVISKETVISAQYFDKSEDLTYKKIFVYFRQKVHVKHSYINNVFYL